MRIRTTQPQPVANTKISLRTITTASTIHGDYNEATTDSQGNYDFQVTPGKHAVFINWVQKHERIKNIVVYADSALGSLQSFVLSPTPDQLTPIMLLETKAANEEAPAAMLRAR